MKRFYYKAKGGNVGDDLNHWLWPKVFGDLLDEDSSHLLIGIGTILNHKVPVAKKYTVLSSGYGYGTKPRLQVGEWEFLALRGPSTQSAMNAENVRCLLDGAYLMPSYYQPTISKTVSVAYIPHVDSIIIGCWQEVCDKAGIKLLDPRWPVEKFINELLSCERVLTEAMHGAILADAYDIPWHPVKAYRYINDFKWQDWGRSLDMDIVFSFIKPTFRGDIGFPLKRKVINSVKRICKSLGIDSPNWTPTEPWRSSERHINLVSMTLKELSTNAKYVLSDANVKSLRIEKLAIVINDFKLKHMGMRNY